MKRHHYKSSRASSLTSIPDIPQEAHLANTEIQPRIRLWILRMLVPLRGMRLLIANGIYDDFLFEALGLKIPALNEDNDASPASISAAICNNLRKMYQEAERKSSDSALPACLTTNMDRLSQLVGLSVVERHILEFAVLLHTERQLDNAAEQLGELSSSNVITVLATVLNLPDREVRLALNEQSMLCRTGLMSLNRTCSESLSSKLSLLSVQFADYIVSSDTDPLNLLRDTVRPAQAPNLALDAYPHIATSLNLLHPYLRHALQTSHRGVNVLLYGAPGTGKSELAKALAKVLECELFEVASENEGGDPVEGEKRLRAFRAGQAFLRKRRTLLLFDEIEDVFNDGDDIFGRRSTAQKRKAWINRMLEENTVPTLWLSNQAECLDPAFLRRFDMVIELPIPPKSQRERIVRRACPDLVDEKTIVRIADSSAVAPALVTRAAAVIETLRSIDCEISCGPAIEHLINGTLKAQGHPALRRNDPTRLPETYDPAFIHADANLVAIAADMVRVRVGRLCLYGPPGTGKTAYGSWLAEQLDAPIHIRRASDLLSMWVGESEKLVAAAFREAENDGALLLIDEVDSFLQDRRKASASWEISMVNEMLTQMESFAGVFIASTNLMEGLDQAALRRFDLKVKLDFLRPSQAWGLLERTCVALALPAPPDDLRPPMARLTRLTPGDFATVVRQHRFRSLASPSALVRALAAEVDIKEGAKAVMGFV